MFDFKKDYVFAWPVTVLVPTETGQVEQQFTGLFKLVPTQEIADSTLADPANADANMVRKTLIGWKEDLIEGGKPKVYSDEAREEVIAIPFIRFAIAKAYWDAVGGALRAKN